MLLFQDKLRHAHKALNGYASVFLIHDDALKKQNAIINK